MPEQYLRTFEGIESDRGCQTSRRQTRIDEEKDAPKWAHKGVSEAFRLLSSARIAYSLTFILTPSHEFDSRRKTCKGWILQGGKHGT